MLLTAWILTITTAYLAVVISAALLNGKRFNGLISFVLFLVLDWACTYVMRQATSMISDNVSTLLVSGVCSIVLAAIMYFVTAQIMERKLSV